jgi:hypothetical protein
MSHIVRLQTKVKDPAAVSAACRRLGLNEPVHGTAELFSGAATGLLVQLPGWQYPVVIDTATGAMQYDNYEGAWGEQRKLGHFLQMYTVEKTRLECRKQGLVVSETALADGSIRLQIQEGS